LFDPRGDLLFATGVRVLTALDRSLVAGLIVAAGALGSLFSLIALVSHVALAVSGMGLLPTLYLRFMRRAVVSSLILLCHTIIS
jgi:hypothetical protein